MRRSLWFRFLIGLWAVWFNAALLEAPGVHTCAVHSGVAASAHAPDAAEMPTHMHGAHHASSPSSSHTDACACTCLGACYGVSPFVASAASPNIAAHYAAIAPRRIGNAVVAPSFERPHTRPFANGPPSLV